MASEFDLWTSFAVKKRHAMDCPEGGQQDRFLVWVWNMIFLEFSLKTQFFEYISPHIQIFARESDMINAKNHASLLYQIFGSNGASARNVSIQLPPNNMICVFDEDART